MAKWPALAMQQVRHCEYERNRKNMENSSPRFANMQMQQRHRRAARWQLKAIEALQRGRDAHLEEMAFRCEPAISYSGLGASAAAELPFIR